jgi:hypothetical protein
MYIECIGAAKSYEIARNCAKYLTDTGRLPVTLSKRIDGGFSSKNPINAVSIVSDREKFTSRGSRPPSV